MSTREQLIKARMGVLALAEQMQNVRLACKRAVISRSHYYEIKEAYEKCGAERLAPASRRKPGMPNQIPPELEAQVLSMTKQYPTRSYVRISAPLRLIGVGVAPSAVHAVWQRMASPCASAPAVARAENRRQGGVLTERQIRLLRLYRGRTVDPSNTF